jgi:hypothetical protein
MYRGGLRADSGKALGVGLGDQTGVDAAKSVSDLPRPGECDLHRDLLVEQHPDEQSEWFLGQQSVGCLITD